jgi:hypothetical protein
MESETGSRFCIFSLAKSSAVFKFLPPAWASVYPDGDPFLKMEIINASQAG